MYKLNKISLYQFKNYSNWSIVVDKKIICITGENGVGKTNLLDAIYYACYTKSYFHALENQVQQHETIGMKIACEFEKHNHTYVVKCILRENGKKEISLNDELYTQFSKHIGLFPCVMIAPDDTILITGSSEYRRKYIDVLLCQLDKTYLQHLNTYSKVLQQRNALLKNQYQQPIDLELLAIYNKQLNEYGTFIFDVRKKYLTILIQEISNIYHFITDGKEEVTVRYQSNLDDTTLIHLLQQSFEKDKLTQRTNEGIHKDDLVFFIKNNPLKLEASQGQRKSFLFALKLAQHHMLEKHLGLSPILLLDDVFEKLDKNRAANLLEYIAKHDAQTFITDTDKNRILPLFNNSSDILHISL